MTRFTLLEHLLKQPSAPGLDDIEQVKFTIIKRVSFFALVIHILLVPLFAHIGATTLALVNILSIACWGTGIFLITQGLTSLALRIFCFEVVVHSVIVSATLGMGVGFQYYLWTVSCMLMIDYQLTLKRAAFYSTLLIFIFASLYVLFAEVNYQYKYAQAITYIHFANIVVAGLPMVYAVGLIREITINQRFELTEMASKDTLTKLYNRRFAKQLIKKAHLSCIENDVNLTLVMADIDNFKSINDEFGHDKGDSVLVHVTNTLKQELSEQDIAVRWGGEEFLIALYQQDQAQAYRTVEKLREKIAATSPPELPDLALTVSFGLVEWQPLTTFEAMLQSADKALYESKQNGRNQTTISTAQVTPQVDQEPV